MFDEYFIPFRYQGQYADIETELYYNRFRYYDPEIGQYITQDPIGLEGGNPTLYSYVSNPNWWVDPLGLERGIGNNPANRSFPDNPYDILPNVTSVTTPRGNIKWEPNQFTRVQFHPGTALQPGEIFIPRHHNPHFHVEIRINPLRGWNNSGNVTTIPPPGWTPGTGTGFLPGESFPGNWVSLP